MKQADQFKESIKLIESLLDQEKTLPFTYTGESMFPALRSGAILKVKKCTKKSLRVGALVLFEDLGAITVHRICFKWFLNGKLWIKSKGDFEKQFDLKRDSDQIIGIVVSPKESFFQAYLKVLKSVMRYFI